MKIFHIIALFCIGTYLSSAIQAYTYTFSNKSDQAAEIQFRLAADIVAGSPTQTVKAAAHKEGSITIPEWYRAGLCIDLTSIQIKFSPENRSPENRFRYPVGTPDASQFESIVKTKELPQGFYYETSKPEGVFRYHKAGFPISILCGDRTFEFTNLVNDPFVFIKY